jgi:hypothetical protein
MGMGLTTTYECNACGLRFELGGFTEVASPPYDHGKAFSVTYLVCAACGTQHWMHADDRCCLYARAEPATREKCKLHNTINGVPYKWVELPPDHLVGELVERPKEWRLGWQTLREWLNSGRRPLKQIFILKCGFCGSDESLEEAMTQSLRTCPHCHTGRMQNNGGKMF